MASKKKVEDVEAREDKKAVKASKKANAPAPKETKKAGQKAKAPVKEEAKPQKKKKAEPVEEAKVEETAEAITPETSKEAKEEEAAQKKPFTTARPKPLPRPVEKSTLDLDEETKRLLAARKSNKASLPAFNRIDSHKNKSLALSWRKPKGHHSQLRRQRKAKGSLVKIGFGSPAAVRGLHASGYEEVIVHRPQDVQGITKTQAIRVSGTVGRKKQTEIEKVAKELNIKVLNPLNVFGEVE